MRIVFFGTYDTRRHPRVETLREGFEALGDEVIECNVPLEFDTAARVRLLRAPWLAPRLLVGLVRAWGRLRRQARRLPPPDVALVGYLGHLDVHLARRLWPDACLLLDHLISLRDTAIDRRAENPLLLRLLTRLDEAAVRTADVPVVDTHGHRELLPPDVREDAVVVPVGAPSRWFRAPHEPPGDRTRVVFFGLYTPLQGCPTIGRALSLLADEPRLAFTMIGRGQDLATTRRVAASNPRITWHDWVDARDLPEVVADHDVCLGIFGTGDKARRVVPNKVFQGAAAGCAVVTSDTVPQREALKDAGSFVPPGDAEALARILRRLAMDRDRLGRLRRAAYRRAEADFRPEHVVRQLRSGVVQRQAGTSERRLP